MCCIVCFLTSNLERFQTLHNIFCIYFGNSALKQSTGLPSTLNQQAAVFIFAFHFCKQTPSCTALNTEMICCALAAQWCPELCPAGEGAGEGIILIILILLLLPGASWAAQGCRRGSSQARLWPWGNQVCENPVPLLSVSLGVPGWLLLFLEGFLSLSSLELCCLSST